MYFFFYGTFKASQNIVISKSSLCGVMIKDHSICRKTLRIPINDRKLNVTLHTLHFFLVITRPNYNKDKRKKERNEGRKKDR